MGLRLAVLGANAALAREMLTLLHEREFPIDDVVALGPRSAVGAEISFGDRDLKCRDAETFDFSTYDLCLMAAPPEEAIAWGPRIAGQKCLVIDTSTAWRLDPRVPLVTPEANPEAARNHPLGILASPSALAIQLAVALAPLHAATRVRRIVAATYQAVSDAGREASDELWTQTRGMFVNDEMVKEQFPAQIAFNVIPQVDDFMEDGSTREEWRLMVETKKIIDPAIKLTATAVRVPVFVGHAMAVNVELTDALSEEEARDLLRASPGVMVVDKREEGGYVTPVESVGEFAVFVSRLREDFTVENGLNFWIVADNLRKGAALNAVQIAELMMSQGVFRRLTA